MAKPDKAKLDKAKLNKAKLDLSNKPSSNKPSSNKPSSKQSTSNSKQPSTKSKKKEPLQLLDLKKIATNKNYKSTKTRTAALDDENLQKVENLLFFKDLYPGVTRGKVFFEKQNTNTTQEVHYSSNQKKHHFQKCGTGSNFLTFLIPWGSGGAGKKCVYFDHP